MTSTTRRREAVKAELIADAERALGTWGKSVVRNLNRHVDAYLLYDTHLDLRTIYLQRWSPETQALIKAAREAVAAAMKAAYKEI
jgi:hypothetical protein